MIDRHNSKSTPRLPREMSSVTQLPVLRKASRFSIWHAFQTLVGISVVMATLFTMWSPGNIFPKPGLNQPANSNTARLTATPHPSLTPGLRPKIALISGHMNNDPGATCPDGLTEASVNYSITFLLQRMLREDGFDVDIMGEKDQRLFQFEGLLMLSIHNDTCQFISTDMSGFKVAVSYVNPIPENPKRLLSCLSDRYGKKTNLRYHANTITPDMTRYHAFDEINNKTTAAIIETGFLNLDRDILVNQTERVAQGVREGILCFVRNEPVTPTRVPSP